MPKRLDVHLLIDVCADDILITKGGYENLTTAPKGIEEMKKIINS